jgi:undecaprenyl-diphosphatase
VGFLKSVDELLFAYANQSWSASWLDGFMQAVSDTYVLSGVITAVLLWMWKVKKKKTLHFVVLLALALGLTDLLAYRFLKPYVQRYRPCHEAAMMVRLVVGSCGGDYSFPSNHAANAMAGVTVLSLQWGRVLWPLVIMAILVGYSRVYLGVHYPSDVLGGFMVGLFAGWLVYAGYTWVLRRWGAGHHV